MRKLICTIATGLTTLVAVTGAMATSPAGGPIAVYATASDGITGKIIVAGAIGDYGNTFTMDKNGKGDPNGNYVKITLKQGSFLVNSTVLNQHTSKAGPEVSSSTTCSFAFIGKGPVTLSHGTGLYEGISGTVNITIEVVADGPAYTTGPNKGKCNMSNDAKPLAQYGVILGKGVVSFH